MTELKRWLTRQIIRNLQDLVYTMLAQLGMYRSLSGQEMLEETVLRGSK